MPTATTTTTTTPRKTKSYNRGNSRHYSALARASNQARIKRYITCETMRDHERVTAFPVRKRETDAGYDVSTPDAFSIGPGATHRQPLGLRINCPPGYFYQIVARSGLSAKGVNVIANVIDATYTGELVVQLVNHSKETHKFRVGDRIAQLLFLPQLHVTFEPVSAFTEDPEGRGTVGWGESGR